MQLRFLSMHVISHKSFPSSKSSFEQKMNIFQQFFKHDEISLIRIEVFVINKKHYNKFFDK
jgi:flagellar biosynthesis regulator FlbT